MSLSIIQIAALVFAAFFCGYETFFRTDLSGWAKLGGFLIWSVIVLAILGH